jgi:hypothetical protein
VLESKYGSPKIVNDGVTIAREVELEDPVENIGAKLVRQAAARTNDTAGDGTTTATILSAAFIAEGLKIVAAGEGRRTSSSSSQGAAVSSGSSRDGSRRSRDGSRGSRAVAGGWVAAAGDGKGFLRPVKDTSTQHSLPVFLSIPQTCPLTLPPVPLCALYQPPVPTGTNPVQLTRGMDKTVAALVGELKALSTEVANDKDLANVAAVSAGEHTCWQQCRQGRARCGRSVGGLGDLAAV